MPESRRPRILLVTRNLPPLVGGMERLNWHMAKELARTADVRVIGPAGSAVYAPDGVSIREAPLEPIWMFLWCAWRLARREARTWKPDAVLAGSGLTAPIARAAANKCGATTCVYVHGLDVAVKHFIYRAIWLPAISGMDRVIANSRATAELCRGIGVEPKRLTIVHPGVDLPSESLPSTSPVSANSFRIRHQFGDQYLLLSVGRLSTRKGLCEFVTSALPRIVAARPDSILLVVGDPPTKALHAEAQTPESIRAAAEAAGVGKNVRLLGKISDTELSELYYASDVHVFPVRSTSGDPEGFGMVAIEAAAHGLPTVAFNVDGVMDAVGEEASGYLVSAGDYAQFACKVIETMDESRAGRFRESAYDFARGFRWSLFGDRIREIVSNK